MSIASEISRITGNIADAYTAASGKGATMPATQNSANLASTISSITTGGGGKYELLERIKDDSNNEIGTVVGFHTDANNTEYAIVCLDAQFRLLEDGKYLSNNIAITDLPQYTNASVYNAKETATFNCDKILAQATASGLTSTAVSHCRSKTFTVDNVQYAGQLPTLMELLKIFEFMTEVNAADTSASQYSSLVLSTSNIYWSSSQNNTNSGWVIIYDGRTYYNEKYNSNSVAPILEIPNA